MSDKLTIHQVTRIINECNRIPFNNDFSIFNEYLHSILYKEA